MCTCQAVFEAGEKQPLPWNVPEHFNVAQERWNMHMLLDRWGEKGGTDVFVFVCVRTLGLCRHSLQQTCGCPGASSLCCRVAHCVNVLLMSHAAQAASAATAHLLSSLLRPVDPAVSWQLCAQQQQAHLRSASCAGAVRLRVHAEVHAEAAALEGVLRCGLAACREKECAPLHGSGTSPL